MTRIADDTHADHHRTRWGPADHAAAELEGWDIVEAYGDAGTTWQLQRLHSADVPDGGTPLPYSRGGDTAAWEHVVRRAEEGDELAQRALAFLGEHEPAELRRVRQC